MKTKIAIFIVTLYFTAFAQLFLALVDRWVDLESYVVLLTDVVITYLGISVFSLKPVRFTLYLILLLFFSTVNYLHDLDSSLASHLNGLRELITIFFGFVFCYKIFTSRYQEWCNIHFRKFTWIFLCMQIPFCAVQFIKYGASDAVSGTLLPGNTGVLTLSIFILVFYYIISSPKYNSQTASIGNVFVHSYMFIPVFLNETKITFVLIALFFMCQMTLRISSVIVTLTACVVFVTIFSISYSNQGKKFQNPLQVFTEKKYLEAYFIDDARHHADVPRMTKIKLAFALLARDNTNLLVGKEYGAFKGGNVLSPSGFSHKYNWLLKGSRPTLFYLLITGGLTLIVGVLFFMYNELLRKPTPGFQNNSSQFLLFLGAIFLMVLFYNDAFRTQLFTLAFSYCLCFSKYYRKPWTANGKNPDY